MWSANNLQHHLKICVLPCVVHYLLGFCSHFSALYLSKADLWYFRTQWVLHWSLSYLNKSNTYQSIHCLLHLANTT